MTKIIPGSLHVANDVLADIVGNAVMECYGVVGMTAEGPIDGIAKLLPANRLRKGVKVISTPEGAQIDLYVVIEYGTNINTVSKNVSEKIDFVLKEYAKVPVASINVHVQGIKVRK